MTCGRCEVAECHRVARAHGLRLCRRCFDDAVRERLGDELDRWVTLLDAVADDAARLPWNDGGWSAADHVGLEDGRVRLDLHGLDGPLAARAAAGVADRLAGARLPSVRVVVGEGGDDVLRTAALRALAATLSGGVAVRPAGGHLDVDSGPVRLADVVAAGHPAWRDPPRRRRRAPRAPSPDAAWRAVVHVVGRLRARLADRRARR